MSEERIMKLEKLDEYRWRIPADPGSGMHVPGIVYASEAMIPAIQRDNALQQVANTATLPGVERAALAMPDIHYGYGFPIGGVVACREEDGVVSPGGVGFDINCGVRLLTTNLSEQELRKHRQPLVERLFREIPTGVGSRGKLKLNRKQLEQVMVQGAQWAVKSGFGRPEDIPATEAQGRIPDANPDLVSQQARQRGKDQVGTLGSGNHFIEVQVVDEIYDEEVARVFGLWRGQVAVMIHSGSRGLGHQVCTDYLGVMKRAAGKHGIRLVDRQLACAPVRSDEGRRYLGALACAANFAWANRQCLTHWVRQVFAAQFGKSDEELGLMLLYDVSHNIVRLERHVVAGRELLLAVHRKGATRAFGPGRVELSERYRGTGQPVIIPGDMGRASFVLVGTRRAMEETFGSTCHGAGRLLSRAAAVRRGRGRAIHRELADRGIAVRAAGRRTLLEEMPEAYKDVAEVVEVVHNAGISCKVARLRPVGVIKG
jgi:tRNA-splicing ligase RtcB